MAKHRRHTIAGDVQALNLSDAAARTGGQSAKTAQPRPAKGIATDQPPRKAM